MMKKIFICIFVLISGLTYGQTIRSLLGLNPVNGMPNFIYRDTAIDLPYTSLKYLTGYGTFGFFADTVRQQVSLTTTGTSGAATYNSSTGVFNIPQYSGGSAGWALTGNASITPITNFLGTTDNNKLYIRTNNILKAWVDSATSALFVDSFPIWRGLSKGYNLSSIGMGDSTLNRNTTGFRNTAIGDSSLVRNTTGSNNTALGYGSYVSGTTGSDNTALGSAAMGIGIVTGSYNVAIGSGQALYRNTSGSHNFAAGYLTLTNNTIGDHNIAIGDASQNNSTSGISNISIGQGIMNSASFSGSNNIGLGTSSLTAITTGVQNTSIGFGSSNSNTTASGNSVIGATALQYNQTGSYNVAVGNFAGKFRLGGANAGNSTSSIFIGDSTRMNNINQIHQIVIGNNVTGLGSYTTVLGDSSTLLTQIYGNIGIGFISSPSAKLHIGAGTAAANTAPQKYTAGTLTTTIESLTEEANASSMFQSNVALNRYAMGGIIADFVADINNSGTSETDLLTYTTKASTLAATGEKVMFEATGTFNDVTATSQLQFYFGGTNIGNTGALTVSATGAWAVKITVIRTGASTARSTVNLSTPGASTAVYTTETDLTGLTFTNTNIIKITGTAGGAGGGSSDITAKMGTIFWWGAANN